MRFIGTVPLRTGPPSPSASPAFAALAATLTAPRDDEARAPALEHHEKARIRAAAFRVTRLYPGPVGELAQRELLAWEEFGHRFDQHGLAGRLVHHIMTADVPARS